MVSALEELLATWGWWQGPSYLCWEAGQIGQQLGEEVIGGGLALWLGFWSQRDTRPERRRESLEVSEATSLCPCPPGILTHCRVREALLGLGGRLSCGSVGASSGLRGQPQGGCRAPGDGFVNRTALSVEVIIIVVIFNKFLTKEAEEAGLCGLWGTESAVLLTRQRACAHPACQCQRRDQNGSWMDGWRSPQRYLAHVCRVPVLCLAAQS